MSTADRPIVRGIVCDGMRRAQLREWDFDQSPLGPDEVTGRTLVSLISPGTEINALFDAPGCEPGVGGYAAVWEVESVGSSVNDLLAGQLVLSLGRHMSRQRARRADLIPLPTGLAPEIAPFARLAGVSWTTLSTTRARPADRVLIVGLGIVGNLAAQLFTAAGYRVTAVDPVAARLDAGRSVGLIDLRQAIPTRNNGESATYELAVDCAGHERAVLDAAKVVRQGGEVVLIGVPWKQRSDSTAFELLHTVFHNYVTLRSGWEWEIPLHPEGFRPHSIYGNIASALDWLQSGRLQVAHLMAVMSPVDATEAYVGLLEHRLAALSVVFDWRMT